MLSLTHTLSTCTTTGYYKRTSQSDPTDTHSPTDNINSILSLLKSATSQLANPFLLPVIMLHDDLGHIEDRQRSIRRQVRRIEDALGLRSSLQAGFNPFGWAEGVVDFEMLNREIVETSAQLQKRKPGTYLEILGELEVAMGEFDSLKNTREGDGELLSRVRFQIRRVRAMERYFAVTNARLNAQINAVSIPSLTAREGRADKRSYII
jgi:hypothetical protein